VDFILAKCTFKLGGSRSSNSAVANEDGILCLIPAASIIIAVFRHLCYRNRKPPDILGSLDDAWDGLGPRCPTDDRGELGTHSTIQLHPIDERFREHVLFRVGWTSTGLEGLRGYAIRFQRLLTHVSSLLPHSEVIERALRVGRTVYPDIALREIIANALIHQDFSVTGAGPLIEIFDDRIEISYPGSLLPSKRLDRLIGTQPESHAMNAWHDFFAAIRFARSVVPDS
jgi:hypothetical protein